MSLDHKRMAKAEVSATGKRFCTGCQSSQPAEGGKKQKFRWVCAACVYRRQHGITKNLSGSRW